MPRRRTAVVVPVLALALVGGLALVGCSGDQEPAAPSQPSIAAPTAVGDRPLVEVLDAGADDRQVLALDLEPGVASQATIEVSQEVSRDELATQVPPVSIPFTSVATAVDGEGADEAVTTTQTYAEPTVDATGLTASDVAEVRTALAPLAGTVSTLVVRPDGTTVDAASGVPAAASVDGQVRELVAVLPSEAVGIGARWTSTSVAEVDGAVVDQVATYTLTALEGEDYGIEVTIEQTYRPGLVEGVQVRSGRGTVNAQLTGNLGRLLPDRASGDVATQVSFVVGGQTTEVRTSVALTLRAR